MKEKTKKIIYRKVVFRLVGVATILVLAACAAVTGPDVSDPLAGKGLVNISLRTNTGPSASVQKNVVRTDSVGPGDNRLSPLRTILPGSVTTGAFDTYDLDFTVVAGESGTAQSFTDVTSLTAALDTGKYDLVLTAKKGGTVVATGESKDINVTDGNTTPVSVPLVFKPEAGNGTLSFTITRPSGLDLSDAQFALTPLHSGGTNYGKDWLKILYEGEKRVSHSSDETVASGYYQATVTLFTPERKAVKYNLVHIGAGQTTTLSWTFVEGDFATIVEDIWLLGVNNQWQTYGDANKLTQAPDGTFVWEGDVSNPAFRFSLEDTSTWSDDKDRPNRFQPADDGSITLDTDVVMTYVGKNDGGAKVWNLAAAGYYRFVVNPYGKTVTVTKPSSARIAVTSTDTEVLRGTTLQFTVTVDGKAPTETVIWAVSGKDKDGKATTPVTGTSIDANGLLTVAAAETAVDLVVEAVVKEKGATLYKETTVFVRKFDDIYAIGNDFTSGWAASTSGSKMTYTARGVYTLTDVFLTKAHTFKFRDGTVTDWSNGNWFYAGTGSGEDATTGEKWVGVRSSSGNNNWTVSHGGKYTITLKTAQLDSMSVAFKSTKQVITITGGPSALAPGDNGTFTYTTDISETDAPVTWNVSGDNSNAPGDSSTGVAAGVLTLGSGEGVGHKLYVTATSLGETVRSSDYPVLGVPVIDANVWVVGGMNSWTLPGSQMTRNGAIFTWTGDITSNDDQGQLSFRFTVSDQDSGNWTRDWLVPHESNNTHWENNTGDGQERSVYRWANSNPGSKWIVTDKGSGSYTITLNLATRKLTVTKN